MRWTFFTAAAIAVIGCGISDSAIVSSSSNPKPHEELARRIETFLDRDLLELNRSSKSRLLTLLNEVLPDNSQSTEAALLAPFYIWRWTGNGGMTGFVLFRVQTAVSVPGQAFGAIDVFKESGQHFTGSVFPTGWRLVVKSASTKFDPTLITNIIELGSVNLFGTDIARQFFCVYNDRIILLGLEDSQGDFVPNNYEFTNWTIGPPIQTRTAEEWEKALYSDQVPIVIEALTWLGGIHRRDLSPSKEMCLEELESAQRYAAVRSNPAVDQKIRQLTESNNTWIKRAAQLAMKQHDE